MPIPDELRSQIIAQIMQSAFAPQQEPDYAELMLKQQAQAEENQYRQDALGLQRQGIEATTGQTAEERQSRERQAREDRRSRERLERLGYDIHSRQVGVLEDPPEQRPPPKPLPGTPEAEGAEALAQERKQREEDRKTNAENLIMTAKRIAAEATNEAIPSLMGGILETIKHPLTRRTDYTYLRRRFGRNVMDELGPTLKEGKIPETTLIPIVKIMMREKFPSLTDEELSDLGL